MTVDTSKKLIDLNQETVKKCLPNLLQDRTTGKNIIWATDAYASHGLCCQDNDQIQEGILCGGRTFELQPRISKSSDDQAARTRNKAEVFTPVWLCNEMNNYLDEEWFSRKDVFNLQHSDHNWDVIEKKILFPDGKTWKDYIFSNRLEITCGEAPFLVSRYDAATGQLILPPIRRIGLLDRKLRIVTENTRTRKSWIQWAMHSLESCYGYEYQGDNLLIARINVLMTVEEWYEYRWNELLNDESLIKAANIISWNLWQMDGLTDAIPRGKFKIHGEQVGFFGDDINQKPQTPLCTIKDWRANKTLAFHTLKEGEYEQKIV